MAVIRRDPKDLDELGPKLEIFREAVSILNAHSKVFNLIMFALMLPQAILLVVVVFFTYRNLPESFLPSEEPFGLVQLLVSYYISVRDGSPVPALDVVRLLLTLAVGTILFRAVLGLSLAPTLYAVILHYDGQPVSFLDLLRASTPYLCIRLFLTNAYCYVLVFSILLGQILGVILLIQSKVAVPWLVLGVTVLVGLSLVGEYFLGIIFTIASGVAVLDKDYGWAAVNASLKLLKGKVKLAVLLQLRMLALDYLDIYFHDTLRLMIIEGDFSGWALRIIVTLCVIVIYPVWICYSLQIRALYSGVQYMSFKASHNRKQTTEGEYERLGDGA